MTSWLVVSILITENWTKHFYKNTFGKKRKWFIALLKIEGSHSLRSKCFYPCENCMPAHENPWKFEETCQLFVWQAFLKRIPLAFHKEQDFFFFFHRCIMAIKWTEDCSWALPRPYTDINRLFSACKGMQESSWSLTKSLQIVLKKSQPHLAHCCE